VVLRGRKRLVLAAAVMFLVGFANCGSAEAAPRPAAPTGPAFRLFGLTVGVENGRYLYGVGPAAIVRRLCVNGVDDGAVCVFTGRNETGIGAFLVIGNAFRDGVDCADVPLRIVDSVDNTTTEAISIYNGTCAAPGPQDATVASNATEDIPPADAQI
jgi:hypothetical protein